MPLGEFELIARYFDRPITRSDVLLGIGDDAAVLDVPRDRKLVVAIDTIVEGVHFPVGTDAMDIGYRALAVNLSDLAAMGAVPAWFTLSLSLTQNEERWLERFASGLFELATLHDIALVGGDTVKGPLSATVQIAGWVESERWLTRSGARPGDLVVISGIPGEAAGGLATLLEAKHDGDTIRRLQQRFLRPTPRVALGRALREIASAAMDVSDGLLTDLDKLCAASHCGAMIDLERIPRSDDLESTFGSERAAELALAGGDDYELLFTIAADRFAALRADVACTVIGVITDTEGVVCARGGVPVNISRRGYDHFSQGTSQ